MQRIFLINNRNLLGSRAVVLTGQRSCAGLREGSFIWKYFCSF